MDTLTQDLRYALRRMLGAPALSGVAVAVLALGIGTSAVVLTVVDGIFFGSPPGVGSTEDMVEVWSIPETGPGARLLTFAEVQILEEMDGAVAEVGAYTRARVGVGSGAQPEMASAELVSPEYFAAAEVAMERGSGFPPEADSGEGMALVVLGHAYWRDRLGSREVVGEALEVNGHPFVVVGVAPERFYGVGGGDDPIAVWLPVATHDLLFPSEEPLDAAGDRRFGAVARLTEGMTAPQAEAAVGRAWRAAETSLPTSGPEPGQASITPYRGLGSRIVAEAAGFVGVTGGLVAVLVLLIACANVSGLLLGRSLRRSREIGVRLTLGASRRRIVRQLLTESLLLAGASGTAGLLLTYAILDTLERRLLTFPVELAPRPVTVALVLATTALAGVAVGLTPALHATRSSVFAALKDQVAGLSRRASLLREGFTVGQLALTLPLLAAAWLLGNQAVDHSTRMGLDHADALAGVRIHVRGSGYSPEEVESLLSRLRQRVAARPEIQAATLSSVPPVVFVPSPWFARPGPPDPGVPPSTMQSLLRVTGVDADYFSTVGLPIVRGRGIGPSDAPGAPLVAVVDAQVARTAWRGEDPLGRTLTIMRGEEEATATVVGVARSVRDGPAASPANRIVYAPARQLPGAIPSVDLVVRWVGDDASMVGQALRAEVRALDPDLPVNVWTLPELLRTGRTELAHASVGASVSALVALLLACVGLYGMIAAGVTDRSREIGVRMALGADRPRIVTYFVRRGLASTLWALSVGLPLAFITVAVVGTGVVGVEAFTPEVALGLGAVALLMMAVGLLSSWLPAQRSGSVDPVQVLRAE